MHNQVNIKIKRMPLNKYFATRMKFYSYFKLAVVILIIIFVFSYLTPNRFRFTLNANKERRVKIKKLPEALIIGSPKCGKYLK